MENKNEWKQDGMHEVQIDIFELVRYLLRRFRFVACAALAGTLIAAIYVFIIATPMYEATAQLYVVNSKDSVINLSDLQIGSYLTSDYQLVFKTWEINQQVIENLGLDYTVKQLREMTSVENPSNTRALNITVTSPDAAEAARIANEIASVGRQYIADTMLTEKPSILSTALQALNPVSPNKKMFLVLGFMAGVFMAVVVLIVFYIRDDRIKTSSDVLKYTGMQPLAVIPIIEDSKSKRKIRW